MGFTIRGGGGSGTGTGGTTDHNALTNKNLPNQHSIDAITGLLDELGKRPQTTDVNTMINSIIDGAPEAYNTLKEIADYIAQDQSAGASILAALGNKVDKEAGKGLSSNDYTNIDKGKVHDHANKNILDQVGESTGGNFTYKGIEISGGSGGANSPSYFSRDVPFYASDKLTIATPSRLWVNMAKNGYMLETQKTFDISADASWDSAATLWQANHDYAVNDVIYPSATKTGYYYRCTTAGNSSTLAPTFPTTLGLRIATEMLFGFASLI